jgi:hypothetical protein
MLACPQNGSEQLLNDLYSAVFISRVFPAAGMHHQGSMSKSRFLMVGRAGRVVLGRVVLGLLADPTHPSHRDAQDQTSTMMGRWYHRRWAVGCGRPRAANKRRPERYPVGRRRLGSLTHAPGSVRHVLRARHVLPARHVLLDSKKHFFPQN